MFSLIVYSVYICFDNWYSWNYFLILFLIYYASPTFFLVFLKILTGLLESRINITILFLNNRTSEIFNSDHYPSCHMYCFLVRHLILVHLSYLLCCFIKSGCPNLSTCLLLSLLTLCLESSAFLSQFPPLSTSTFSNYFSNGKVYLHLKILLFLLHFKMTVFSYFIFPWYFEDINLLICDLYSCSWYIC